MGTYSMTGIIKGRSMLEQLVASIPCTDSGEDKDVYRIGDLARDFNVTLRTLRFYEDRGLISPQRSGSTRLYSKQDRKRVEMILFAKRVGFSLVDIQDLLEIHDAGGQNDAHKRVILDKFASQLAKLKSQKKQIERSIDDLSDAIHSLKNIDVS